MAYDERLAARVRDAVGSRRGVTEKKMFGGLAVMLDGNMAVGVIDADLMVRVGPDGYDAALKKAHARPMDFTGKPLKGMVYVGPQGVRTKKQLESWVARGVEHAASLPKKAAKKAAAKKKKAPSRADASSFTGFPKETFRFLAELERNNEKAWLDAHRDDYQAFYVDPARAFVEAMAPEVRRVSGGLQADARVNKSLFRIQRDTRFSKDKRPYKPHVDLWFWEGPTRSWEAPGLFMRLMPEKLILGAGIHRFGKAQLAAFRRVVDDAKQGPALAKTLSKATAAGPYTIGGATREKVPRGFSSDHPRADLLLHEGLFVELEQRLPKEIHRADFVAWCGAHFRAMAPVHRWLLDLS